MPPPSHRELMELCRHNGLDGSGDDERLIARLLNWKRRAPNESIELPDDDDDLPAMAVDEDEDDGTAGLAVTKAPRRKSGKLTSRDGPTSPRDDRAAARNAREREAIAAERRRLTEEQDELSRSRADNEAKGKELAQLQAQAQASNLVAGGGASTIMPPNLKTDARGQDPWQQVRSGSGAPPYYWNTKTGEVRWTLPSQPPPPPPPPHPPPPPPPPPGAIATDMPPADPGDAINATMQQPSLSPGPSQPQLFPERDRSSRYSQSPGMFRREVGLLRREHFVLSRELREVHDPLARQRLTRTIADLEIRLLERGQSV